MYSLGSCWDRLGKITKNISLSDVPAGIRAGYVPSTCLLQVPHLALVNKLSAYYGTPQFTLVLETAHDWTYYVSHMTKVHSFTSSFLIININIVPSSSLRFSRLIFFSVSTPPQQNYSMHFYTLTCMLRGPPHHHPWCAHRNNRCKFRTLPTLQNNFTVRNCTENNKSKVNSRKIVITLPYLTATPVTWWYHDK